MALPVVRIRTRGEILNNTRHYTETAFNGSIITDQHVAYESLKTGEFEKMTDVITPGWSRKRNSGAIIFNPMSQSKERRTSNFQAFHARRNSGSGSTVKDYQGSGCYVDVQGGATPTVDWQSLEAEAGTKAWAGIDKPVLEGLVEAAEWHKTMDLLKIRSDKLSKACRYILAKNAGKTRKLAKGLGVIGDGWLKYRYGIMPIIKSMDALLQDWNGKIVTTRRVSRGFANGSADSTNTVSHSGGTFWSLSAANSWEVTEDVRCGVLYDQYSKSNRYGFNLSDLPAAAWELVPYSFVADWFVNAGDFIRAYTPKVGVEPRVSWTKRTSTAVCRQVVTPTWKSPSGYTEIAAPSGSREIYTETVYRTRGTSRRLVFKESSVPPILTAKRVIDSFFLAFNLVRS